MPGRLALVLCLLFSRWQSADVKLLGTAGDIRFVVVAAKVAKSDDELRKTAHLVCGDTPICGVRFWVAEAHAARRLPMTDDQARNQVAAYTINKNTGVDDFTCQPTAGRAPPCTPAN
jgi:hypothetical protein